MRVCSFWVQIYALSYASGPKAVHMGSPLPKGQWLKAKATTLPLKTSPSGAIVYPSPVGLVISAKTAFPTGHP